MSMLVEFQAAALPVQLQFALLAADQTNEFSPAERRVCRTVQKIVATYVGPGCDPRDLRDGLEVSIHTLVLGAREAAKNQKVLRKQKLAAGAAVLRDLLELIAKMPPKDAEKGEA